LRQHPGIFVTDPKEPHYFALHGAEPDFHGPGDDRFINTQAVTRLADYLALYPDDSRFLARGEGSVSTLYYHEHAIPEMVRMNPDLRVIVLLREPVERAYSSFQYLRTSGREPLADFLAAVAEEPSRRADNWHHLWHYTGMSMYAEPLQALESGLSPEQIGVWFYDDLERDYAGTFQSVLQFLQIPAVDGAGEHVPRVNASGASRLAWAHSAMAWASGRPALRRTARLLTSWRFREQVKTRLLKRQVVPASVRTELQPVFEEDLNTLRTMLAHRVDLPTWLA
jgi:hypothetical protein